MELNNTQTNLSASKLSLSPILPTPMRMKFFRNRESSKKNFETTPKQCLKLINLFGANTPTPLLKLKKKFEEQFLDVFYLEESPEFEIPKPVKPKIQYTLRSLQESESIDSESNSENAIKRRKRKSNNQIRTLKAEYTSGTLWSKEKIEEMSRVTGLSEAQVYKWCWDQKKKYRLTTRQKAEKGYDLRDQNKQLTTKDKYCLKRPREVSAFNEDYEISTQTVSKRLHFN